jgi:hypothetical protein
VSDDDDIIEPLGMADTPEGAIELILENIRDDLKMMGCDCQPIITIGTLADAGAVNVVATADHQDHCRYKAIYNRKNN